MVNSTVQSSFPTSPINNNPHLRPPPTIISTPTPAPAPAPAPAPTPLTNGHTKPPPHLSPSTNLAPISLSAFLLGTTFGLTALLTIHLAPRTPLWRAPSFLTLLSLFHFLEFYITSIANSPVAKPSSFLLSSNGYAYNAAHTLALLECGVHWRFYPDVQVLPASLRGLWLGMGFVMVVFGQFFRTTAMLQAGSNFNHLVQTRKREGHKLVTHGVYGLVRHPSYFGFWWWGLGTQVVLGNWVCLVGYAIVLWRFFKARIAQEEGYLMQFFGEEYRAYRRRTGVGIPWLK